MIPLAVPNPSGVEGFPAPTWAQSACWFSGVTLTRDRVSETVRALRERGVGCRPFWKPVDLQVPYAGAPRTKLPVCDAVWNTILTLPCSTGLTNAEQDMVIEAVRAHFSSS